MSGKELLSAHLLPVPLCAVQGIWQSGPAWLMPVDGAATYAWNVPMDRGITRDRWLSLGLQDDALPVFEAGGLQTIEAAGGGIVGIPWHGDGHHLLGTASSREEAVVVATILRLFNPN